MNSQFFGSGGEALGSRIAHLLEHKLRPPIVERFPDGEVQVCLQEPVRGREVYIVQSTCPPVDEHIMELLAITDACRRACASHIMAVIPYFGYCRSDKRNGCRSPVMGRVAASLLETVGVDHVLTVDLHSEQMEGFFHIPVDSLTATPTLCHALATRLTDDTVVVSPDEGRVKMATQFARRLQLPLAVLHKERRSAGSTRVTHVVGDVRGRPCLIIDDMVSTGGTVLDAIEALIKAGAKPDIRVAATHAVFAGTPTTKISHPAIRQILVTDSVPIRHSDWPQVSVISLAPLLAAAIRRFRANESIGDLFEHVIHGALAEATEPVPD